MLTADTITDEQLVDLICWADYMEWRHTKAAAYVALHGAVTKQTRRTIKRAKSGPIYKDARELCASVLNTRPEILEPNDAKYAEIANARSAK